MRRIVILVGICFLTPCLRAQFPPQFVFTAETGPTTYVEAFSVNPIAFLNGSLTKVATVEERQTPTALAVNPAGSYVFVGNSENTVSVFAVSSTGVPSEIPASPFDAGTAIGGVTALAVDPSGNFLYVASAISIADSNSGELDEYSISSTGELAPVATFQVPLKPIGLFIHPSQNWLYIYGQVSQEYYTPEVQQFTIAKGGVLTAGLTTTITAGDGPSAFAGSVEFLFAAGGTAKAMFIQSLAVNSLDGTLSPGPTLSGPGSATGYAAVDQTGEFLFTSLGTYQITSGILSLFHANTGSQLTVPIYASLISPLLFQGSTTQADNLLSFEVQASGNLAESADAPYPLIADLVAITAAGVAPIPTAPAITFNPPSNIFPTPVLVGATANGSVGIVNSGYGALNITDILIAGNSNWTETNNCPQSLASGASCLVSLTVSPTTLGSITAQLTVQSQLPDASVALAATAVAPYPIVELSASSLTFGPVVMGASAQQSVTVTNSATATAPLLISFAITGANNADFTESNNGNNCPSLDVGASCVFTIMFSPLAIGTRTATLLLTTNANGGTYAIPLAGTGGATLVVTTVGPGTVNQTPTGSTFTSVTPIALTATPNNSTFAGWSQGGCPGSTAPTCAFSLTSNTTVVATFVASTTPPQYTLMASAVGPGTIAQNPVGTSFAAGTALSFTAAPTGTATFSGWSGGCSGTAVTCNFVMPAANATVTATFTAAAPAGSITISPAMQTGNPGQTFTFTAATAGLGSATLTPVCQIPAGGCTVSGNSLIVTTTSTDSTNEKRAFLATGGRLGLWVSLAVACILCFFILPRGKRKTALAVCALCLCSACGSSPKNAVTVPVGGTPVGSYQLELTAGAVTGKATLVIQ